MQFRRAGSGREAISEGREWSEVPPGRPGVVRRPSRRAESGRETFPVGHEWSEALRVGLEWSGGPHKGTGGFLGGPEVVETPTRRVGRTARGHRVVGRPTRKAGSGRVALQRAGSDRESLKEDWEDLPEDQEWSGGPPRVSGVVGRASQKARSGWEALTKGREWS